MKQFPFLAILIIPVLFSSCEPENEKLKAAKKEKLAEISSLKKEVSEIEKRLLLIDSVYAAEQKKSIYVSTIAPTNNGFVHKIEARATVESDNNVSVGPEAPGTVARVHVKEGQKVKKGQVLVSLDSKVLNNSIAELKTQLELATTVYEKRANLWKKNIGTEVAYLQAKTNKEALEQKIKTIQSQRSQFSLYAPFNGTIDDIMAKVGQTASPGFPLLRMVNKNNMYLSADLSEAFVGKFKANDKVTIKFPNMEKSFEAELTTVGQVINPANRTFKIEVILPSETLKEDIKPNMVAVLALTDYENEKALAVPARLILSDNKGEYLFTIKKEGADTKAMKTYVTTGNTYKGEKEILKGLKGNEQIIDQGYRKMTDNLKVSITDKRS